MKGFKKDGKFRPTGNKTKSALKKSDVLRKKETMNKDAEDILKEIHNLGTSEEKMKSFETLVKEEEDEEDEEDEREKLADKLGSEFNKIITVDDAYGSVYGINDEFYKVGVQYGLSAYELEEIRDDIGYEFESVEVGNEHFVNMIFKKIDEKK